MIRSKFDHLLVEMKKSDMTKDEIDKFMGKKKVKVIKKEKFKPDPEVLDRLENQRRALTLQNRHTGNPISKTKLFKLKANGGKQNENR